MREPTSIKINLQWIGYQDARWLIAVIAAIIPSKLRATCRAGGRFSLELWRFYESFQDAEGRWSIRWAPWISKTRGDWKLWPSHVIFMLICDDMLYMIWYDMILYDMIWYVMIWYDIWVCCGHAQLTIPNQCFCDRMLSRRTLLKMSRFCTGVSFAMLCICSQFHFHQVLSFHLRNVFFCPSSFEAPNVTTWCICLEMDVSWNGGTRVHHPF